MRRKKVFPPGTFIPFPQRILAIIQLCLAFSLILWYAAQPFLGEYFNLKSNILLYEYVLGTSNILKSASQKEKLKRNTDRFTSLPEEKKALIQNDYAKLYTYSTRPLLTKLLDGLKALFAVGAFEWGWIIFSILTSVLILLKIEGAEKAAWLLPILVLAGSINNQFTHHVSESSDIDLFPKESVIIQDYVEGQLSPHVNEQRDQLQKGWNRYLAANWSNSNDVEEGEFNFTLARLDKMTFQIPTDWHFFFREKTKEGLMLIYLLWNCAFAWIGGRERREDTDGVQKTEG